MKAGTLEIDMITNVARLQKEMADMKRTVAGAMGDMADSASRADRALNAVGGGGVTRMGGSAKLAGHHVQNLVFQLNDMVVGLFSGQKPMTVFMQQGTQIGCHAGARHQAPAGLVVGGLCDADRTGQVVHRGRAGQQTLDHRQAVGGHVDRLADRFRQGALRRAPRFDPHRQPSTGGGQC